MVRGRKSCRSGSGTQKPQSRYKKNHQRPPPVRTIQTRSQCLLCGCGFNRLPKEVLHMILDKLSVLELSVFSMVSKETTGWVVNYISTRAWRDKEIIQSFHHNTGLEKRSTVGHYKNLGLMFKRCTLLLPTKERLKFIFSKFSQIPCFKMGQCLAPDCIGYTCYGVLLQTLIAGWDALECRRVFNFLCDLTNLLQKTEAVITGKPGVNLNQEVQVRFFCREVLLDSWLNQSEHQFWLMQLLKPWPIVSQARLLFILYGPILLEGTLGWQDLVVRGRPQSNLWDLAKAIQLLFGETVECKVPISLLSIFDELIVTPQPWHVENVARLLVLCDSSLCYTFLASKAVNGQTMEICRFIVHIILVCEKHGYSMSWVVNLVQQICEVFSSAPEKFRFINHLENMFLDVAMESFEFSNAGRHLEVRETYRTLCVLLQSSARFHTKFLHMFLKKE